MSMLTGLRGSDYNVTVVFFDLKKLYLVENVTKMGTIYKQKETNRNQYELTQLQHKDNVLEMAKEQNTHRTGEDADYI